MININIINKKSFIKRMFLFLLLFLTLFIIPYIAVLWVASDFNPDFLSIDSCLDSGGSWDQANRTCSGTR